MRAAASDAWSVVTLGRHQEQPPQGRLWEPTHTPAPAPGRVVSAAGWRWSRPRTGICGCASAPRRSRNLTSGRVREQHPHQRDLGEQLDSLLRDVELDDVQHLGEQQSDVTNTIGALRSARPSRAENRPQAKTTSATNAMAAASMLASLSARADRPRVTEARAAGGSSPDPSTTGECWRPLRQAPLPSITTTRIRPTGATLPHPKGMA